MPYLLVEYVRLKLFEVYQSFLEPFHVCYKRPNEVFSTLLLRSNGRRDSGLPGLTILLYGRTNAATAKGN